MKKKKNVCLSPSATFINPMTAYLRWMTLCCSLLLMLSGFNMETVLEHSEPKVYSVQIVRGILHTVQHNTSISQYTLYTVVYFFIEESTVQD